MSGARRVVFVTGATGLVGGEVLARLLRADAELRAFALVRCLDRWQAAAAWHHLPADRVAPVMGNLTAPGLGLDDVARKRLARDVTDVIHAAADVVFSRPLEIIRETNAAGTRRVLELAAQWPRVRWLGHVSTAFVAGRRVGTVPDGDNGAEAGWVNSYEQSKYEAERLVRAFSRPWVIFRPSAIVFDRERGVVSQLNVVHQALRMFYNSLAPLLPGGPATSLDAVPIDYVAGAIAALACREDLAGATLHLCAGAGALPLGEMLDVTWRVWRASPEWRRKGIPRPAFCDLETFRLFTGSAEETADPHLKRAVRALGHFAPQLALPKQFDTTRADSVLGAPAPTVLSYWTAMIEHLLTTSWVETPRQAAA